MVQPTIIAFDGNHCCGKGSNISRLKEDLKERFFEVFVARGAL